MCIKNDLEYSFKKIKNKTKNEKKKKKLIEDFAKRSLKRFHNQKEVE